MQGQISLKGQLIVQTYSRTCSIEVPYSTMYKATSHVRYHDGHINYYSMYRISLNKRPDVLFLILYVGSAFIQRRYLIERHLFI